MTPDTINKQSHKNRSLDWFKNIYNKLDPKEISSRCNLPFDGGAFAIRIMGTQYRARFPDFTLMDSEGNEKITGFEAILFIRYLCEGRYVQFTGKRLSYREIPWGGTYFSNFENRCIKRLARKFSENPEKLRKFMEHIKAEKLEKSDAGYRFEFMSGLCMSFLLWAGDDEFPASAQILFDDNFVHAFTAEDMALAGDVAINHIFYANNADKIGTNTD